MPINFRLTDAQARVLLTALDAVSLDDCFGPDMAKHTEFNVLKRRLAEEYQSPTQVRMALSRQERDAVEYDIEQSGMSIAAIAAKHDVSIATVLRYREVLTALRVRLGLEPMPPLPKSTRIRLVIDESQEEIRQTYLATGQFRPLARKHNLTTEKLLTILRASPSVLEEGRRRQNDPKWRPIYTRYRNREKIERRERREQKKALAN